MVVHVALAVGGAVLAALCPGQSPDALRALIAFPDFAVPYELDLSSLNRVFEGARVQDLRAKGDRRSVSETLDLLWRTSDRGVSRALAEEVLKKDPETADRVAAEAILGRVEDVSAAYAQVGGASLAERRARVALGQLQVERVLAEVLGPAAGQGWALSPMSVLAVGKILRDVPSETADAMARVRGTIDSLLADLGRQLDATPTDLDAYRVWLRCKHLETSLTMLDTLLNATVDQWAERVRAPLLSLHEQSFERARATGDFDALVEVVAGSASLAGGDALAKALPAEVEALERAAVGPGQRMAAQIASGALRFTVLGDDEGALKALRSAWDLAADAPDVRKALAWPLVVLYGSTAAWRPGLEFIRASSTLLQEPARTQLEAKFLYELGSYEEAGIAVARIDAEPLVLWRSLALATIAARRAPDEAALKAVAEEYNRLLPLLLAGDDEGRKADAMFLAGILAGLLNDRQGAQVALAVLEMREGKSDRAQALSKALGLG